MSEPSGIVLPLGVRSFLTFYSCQLREWRGLLEERIKWLSDIEEHLLEGSPNAELLAHQAHIMKTDLRQVLDSMGGDLCRK